MALVGGGDDGGDGDLLVAVGGVDEEAIVVDADAVVGVAGVEGDLQHGGEGVGGGDVELGDGGILEGEAGLGGAEDEPDHQDDEEDDDDEGEQRRVEAAAELPLLVVISTVLA